MSRKVQVFLTALLAAGLCLPAASFAQEKKSDKEKKKSERQLLKELDTPYKKWLNDEVVYIISDDERAAFLRLETNEEREQFIEQFWLRRDPTPDTIENETKEEHYRRIAYANERFASGAPGWKTDRGRIYIIWGQPDEIEGHPSGGMYNRPLEEGGGFTSTFPFEKWRYRYLEGIGQEIILEFVDKSGTNEYRLEFDPAEKDALLLVPGAGLSEMEMYGMSSKLDRFYRTDGTRLPPALGGQPAWMNPFERLNVYARVQRPPEVKFKDLEEVVTARMLRSQFNFDFRYDFLRVTGDTVLVPITVQIPNRQMNFINREGVHNATLNLYARISSLTGRVVQTFEDVISRDFPESLFEVSLKGFSVYQKAVPLRPGLYRVDVVIKDVNSGDVGVRNERLAVPRFDEDKLATSSLILADQIERVPAKQVGLGQFILGASKVRPRLDRTFTTEDQMGIYLQVYNLKADETSHKPSVTIAYRIRRGQEEVMSYTETSDQLDVRGEQITLEKLVPLSQLAPGKYKLEIEITDNVSKQTISPAAEFTVKAAERTTARN